VKYHAKVQYLIDKVKTGEMEPNWYVIQIDDDERSIHISFYPNKQIRFIYNFKNGRRHGNFYGWNEDGTKKYIRTYNNAKLIADINL